MTLKMMKAITFKRYRKVPEYSLTEVPVPTPQANELLVKIRSAGVNPIDIMIPTGMFKPILKFQFPAILGSDLAGEVVAVGSKVRKFKPGDLIFASVFDLGIGTFAEYAAIPEHSAALKPKNLDFIQASSIPMVALTTWQAMVERANIKPKQKVFIPAGSGGIGTMAIQIAKHLGAHVATTTSAKNKPLVARLGADQIVDYKTQDFQALLHDYDFALGSVRGDTVEKSFSILKRRGKLISLVGPLDAQFAEVRKLNFIYKMVFRLMSRKVNRLATASGTDYSFLFVKPDGATLQKVASLIENNVITPVVDKVFSLNDAVDALDYIAQGHTAGKVVIEIK
jgi:NADPH:quinone reductase-like Zn-dependent oxidoreductase